MHQPANLEGKNSCDIIFAAPSVLPKTAWQLDPHGMDEATLGCQPLRLEMTGGLAHLLLIAMGAGVLSLFHRREEVGVHIHSTTAPQTERIRNAAFHLL